MKILICEGCQHLFGIGLDDKTCPKGDGQLIEVEVEEEEVNRIVLEQLEEGLGM